MEKEKFLKEYLVERKGTNSLKWDALDKRFGNPDLISMWVADMEFKTFVKIILFCKPPSIFLYSMGLVLGIKTIFKSFA